MSWVLVFRFAKFIIFFKNVFFCRFDTEKFINCTKPAIHSCYLEDEYETELNEVVAATVKFFNDEYKCGNLDEPSYIHDILRYVKNFLEFDDSVRGMQIKRDFNKYYKTTKYQRNLEKCLKNYVF